MLIFHFVLGCNVPLIVDGNNNVSYMLMMETKDRELYNVSISFALNPVTCEMVSVVISSAFILRALSRLLSS